MITKTIPKNSAAQTDTFRLLSACFYEPDKQMFTEEELFGQLHSALRQCLPEKAELAQHLATGMDSCSQEDLLVEYTRLFVGPQELLAHPYGSVYLDGPKIIMGNSTLNVMEHYHQADFEVAGELLEMPDHIAIELEFLYLLSYNESLAEAEGRMEDRDNWRSKRENFLQQHLGRWITFFCDKIRHGTDMMYFRTLADLTEGFVINQLRKAD